KNMIVNGKVMNFKEEITIEELLRNFHLDMDKVVVEVNLEIIAKEKYYEFVLNEEDKIEIISFVGGG
ncbi:MAG: sulfur carrier protein ThiS, partial [Clostridiaceae bacterium]